MNIAARQSHYHELCEHWCFGYGCRREVELCRTCKRDNFNDAMAKRYRADTLTTEELLDGAREVFR